MTAIVIILVSAAAMLVWMIAPERRRMLVRAERIMSTLGDPEERTEFIRFRSARPSLKKEAMNSVIEKWGEDGWVYLKASEAPLRNTICSCGGGLRLHFVRERRSDTEEI